MAATTKAATKGGKALSYFDRTVVLSLNPRGEGKADERNDRDGTGGGDHSLGAK